MTPTEKKYAKYVGQLYFSSQRGCLVLVTGMEKRYGRWRMMIEYYGSMIESRNRSRDAIEIEALVKQGRWLTSKKWLELVTKK